MSVSTFLLRMVDCHSTASEIRQALIRLADKGLIGPTNKQRIEDLIVDDRLGVAAEWVREYQLKERT